MVGRFFLFLSIPALSFLFATLISHMATEASRSSSTSSASPAPTPVATVQLLHVTPTPGPDRGDCAAIRGTPYRSDAERAWFLANCRETSVAPAAPAPDIRALRRPEMLGGRRSAIALELSAYRRAPATSAIHGASHDGQGRLGDASYSTVTVFARLRGWSMSQPRASAMWYDSSCSGTAVTIGSSRGGAAGT